MRRDPSTPRAALSLASVPVYAALGIALPLSWLAAIDSFLLDFRPSALVAIYGTAWLMLAALLLPFYIGAAIGLVVWLGARRAPSAAHRAQLVVLWMTGGIIVAAVLASFAAWLRSFGLVGGESLGTRLTVFAFVIAIPAVLHAAGRSILFYLGRLSQWTTALGAAAALTIAFSGWTSASRMPATSAPVLGTSRPNIVLLTVDTLSAEHMSLYGAARRTTPGLAAFAQSATTFTRAYANANFTTSGIASILTGTRPWTHRALQLPDWASAATRARSLPALLRRSGYRMGYVAANPFAAASRNGFGAYFDFALGDREGIFRLCSDRVSAILKYTCAVSGLSVFTEIERLANRFHRDEDNRQYDPRLAIEPALTWLQSVDKRQPIFLWVHLDPPHSPYAAPKPWLGRFDSSGKARRYADSETAWLFAMGHISSADERTLEARYDEAVSYVDYYASDFLARAQGILGSNTVFIITADHGESFGHGYGAHTGPGLYDEIIHIPLIIKLPGQATGSRSAELAEQVDIAPTLAQLAGTRSDSSWEGRSLVPDMLQARSDERVRSPVFSMNFEENGRFAALRTGSVAVIDGDWKLVHPMGALHYELMPKLDDELYDLARDPRERANLASARPVERNRLLGLINEQLAIHGGPIH